MAEIREQQLDETYKVYTQCNGCGKKLLGPSSASTYHLDYHILNCEKLRDGILAHKEGESSAASSSTTFSYDDKRQRQALTGFVCARRVGH